MQAEKFESYSPKRPTRPGYLIALAAVCGHLFDFLSNDDLVAFTKAIQSALYYTAYAELFVFTKKPIGCHINRGRKGRVVCCRIPEVTTQKICFSLERSVE